MNGLKIGGNVGNIKQLHSIFSRMIVSATAYGTSFKEINVHTLTFMMEVTIATKMFCVSVMNRIVIMHK
jgi:hypothetical protein